ncbi:MAG: hypothetical protein SPK00_10930 [Corynebacterium glucuronolyticum]|nr:PLP-dependent decarboxylase [Corynebacterium glucuronolyticum]MDD7585487.1 hypothetical protein [Mycobacteriaceae bacterium]MDY5835235.1 hypothetical protein [Corynebacterium glucuronolyticum]
MLLVKDRTDLVRAFSAGGEYLQDVEGGSQNPDWWDMGPELTLQTVGTERLTQMIDSSIAVAKLFEKEIATVEGISIVTPACHVHDRQRGAQRAACRVPAPSQYRRHLDNDPQR